MPDADAPRAELGFGRRLLGLVVAWGVLFGASPGVVTRDGSAAFVVLAVALWGLICARPGRLAPLAELLAAALGWAGLMGWAAYVWPPLLLWIGIGHGGYAAAAGALLRRLARRTSLVWAVPLAWVGVETVRTLVPPPFGLESWQLGHAFHDLPALAGSARVWGLGGLGLVAGALAGAVAELARGALRAPGGKPRVALGLAPAALALVLSTATGPPATRPGPRILLVQPAFEQARKQYGDRFENHREAEALTRAGLARPEGAGTDLVLWGETMVATVLYAPEVREALEAGWTPPPRFAQVTPRAIEAARAAEEVLVDAMLAAWGPAGTRPAFLAGIETYAFEDGQLRRGNAAVLWTAPGERSEPALKVHVVPGAESLFGLERYAPVRDFVRDLAGYVPSLSPGERTGVLHLARPTGRWSFGASICFDNAFLDPFTAPLRREPVDFHVVLSNEAWYRTSWEADQMMAYSRIAALATGRAVVRATNSGISAVVGPDGGEVARLVGDGPYGEPADKMARGVLSAVVPVPAGGAEAPRTLFVRTEPAWALLWIALPALALRRRGRKDA